MLECNEKFRYSSSVKHLLIHFKYQKKKIKKANNNKNTTICKLPKSRHGRILATFLAPLTM